MAADLKKTYLNYILDLKQCVRNPFLFFEKNSAKPSLGGMYVENVVFSGRGPQLSFPELIETSKPVT